jgi:hypothetical protein
MPRQRRGFILPCVVEGRRQSCQVSSDRRKEGQVIGVLGKLDVLPKGIIVRSLLPSLVFLRGIPDYSPPRRRISIRRSGPWSRTPPPRADMTRFFTSAKWVESIVIRSCPPRDRTPDQEIVSDIGIELNGRCDYIVKRTKLYFSAAVRPTVQCSNGDSNHEIWGWSKHSCEWCGDDDPSVSDEEDQQYKVKSVIEKAQRSCQRGSSSTAIGQPIRKG